MIRETYKGRNLKVMRVSERVGLAGLINDQAMTVEHGAPEQEILAQLRRWIDMVDAEPINGDRWPVYMYAPGTYELCDEGHPKTIGQPCRHSFCQRTETKEN